MNFVRLLVLCGFLVVSTSTVAEESSGSVAARELYLNYLNRIQTVSFSAQIFDRVADKGEEYTNLLSEQWKIDFAKKRLWRVATRLQGDYRKRESLVPGPVLFEVVIDSDTELGFSVKRETNTAESITGYLEPVDDFTQRRVGWGYLGLAFGYVHDATDYIYIPDLILDDATVNTSSGKTELLSENNDYKLRIVLGKAKYGGMPEKIELQRKRQQAGQALKSLSYSVETAAEHAGVWLPDLFHCTIEKFEWEFQLPDNVRLIDGKQVLVSSDSKEGEGSITIPASSVVAEVSFSEISLDPLADSVFRPQAKIPNGLNVSMQDAMHLKYAWLDGKVVPKGETLNKTDELFFRKESSTPWFLIVNTVFVLLIVAWFVVSKLRSA